MHSPYLRHLKEIPDGSCYALAMKQNLFCIQPVYTTRVCIQWPICIIGSRDYCHAPLGVSSFSFSIQNVWEMTTVVYKIACRSCTACSPVIVLRLSIADTTSSATMYS